METARASRQWWTVPAGIGLLGVGLSWLAFWAVDDAEFRRVHRLLESRAEWRARDLEAKIEASGSAVESIALAIAAGAPFDPDAFQRIAARVRSGVNHIQALQWAPRVRRDDIPEFERTARAYGLHDYRVFAVTPDFQPTALDERDEYFPILFDARLEGRRQAHGLALGRYEGRRVPMEKARDEGRAAATMPVRPIGRPVPELVYLLFWPVYSGVEVPPATEERRAQLRGYVVGNFNLVSLLDAALYDAPEIIGTIHFSIATAHQNNPAENAVAFYAPGTRRIDLGRPSADLAERPVVRIERHFEAFGQHWDLVFDYSAAVVGDLRSRGAWGWLVAGLLLTGLLVAHLLRERLRTKTVEALVAKRTAELERTSAQLHQAQKMEAIGNLTGGMAHDFNNLLTVIIGNLDLAVAAPQRDPRTNRLLELALDAARRGADLIRQLLAFSRRQPLVPQLTDVNELVSGMLRLLGRTLGEDIEVTFQPEPRAWPTMIDPSLLSAAIANLATNARDAMPKGGRLTIAMHNTHLDADYAAVNPDAAPGDFVLLEISDTGVGMPAETLARAFEPFFTTKEAGQGTGLGLSMVFGFVKQSRGHIKIYSEVGRGTTVRLYLPRAEPTARAAPAAPAAVPTLRQGHETILLVEDRADVRRVVARQLAALGYTVVDVDTPAAALARLRESGGRIDLLLTDLVMPGGMSGRELATAARAARPDLRIVIMSGYPGSALSDDRPLAREEHFLSKPFRRDELARKLREVLDA